jgi:hypothetical protein
MKRILKVKLVAVGSFVLALAALVTAVLGWVEWGLAFLAASVAGAIVLIVLSDRKRGVQLSSLASQQRKLLELTSGVSKGGDAAMASVKATSTALATMDARYKELAAAVKVVDTRTDQMQRRIMATLEVSRLEAADRARAMNAEASR